MSEPTASRAPAAGPRVMKGVSACQRCRRRKQKCDQKYPNCTNCEQSRTPCLTYHSGKQAEIPRNYVTSLEKHVDSLTQEVSDLRARLQAGSISGGRASSPAASSPSGIDPSSLSTTRFPAVNEGSNRLQDVVRSVKDVVVEASRQPRFLGQSSGITLARLVMASIRMETLPSRLVTDHRLNNQSLSAQAAEASLPPRRAADHLVEVYFQYRTPHLPILSRSAARGAFDKAYEAMSNGQPPDQDAARDIFITYMIIAISLCDLPNPSGGRPSQSEGCFRSALSWVEKVITFSKSDIETLRIVLLLAQFVALCPSLGSLWHLAGTALRLAIDTGLHWETEEQVLSMDQAELQDRRCLWYSTYQLDRTLCLTLGRPFGIIDESTCVELPIAYSTSSRALDEVPSTFDAHNQKAHNHLFSMSKLESEIRHVLHSQSWASKPAYPKPDYSVWLQDIQPRLWEWYRTIPPPSEAHSSSIFAYQAYWDYIYNNSILLLYRPSSTSLQQSREALSSSYDASCKLVASIKTLQREGKIDIPWKSTHHLFMAGLGVIYGLWQSIEIRNRVPIGSSISTLQSCTATLSALSQMFPGAAGCRDVFDALSSATVDWLVTHDAEEIRQNRLQFEKQVKDLLQQLQPPHVEVTVNDCDSQHMSSMLYTDNFALGEMLNFAAQWPDFQDMDFHDMDIGFESGTGTE